jgi:hypothetical protein
MNDPCREVPHHAPLHPCSDRSGGWPARRLRTSRALGFRPMAGLFAALAAVASGSCGPQSSDGTDAITHWLECDDTDDCAGGDPCVCGLCMPRCSSDPECRELRADAVCRVAAELEAEGACSTDTSGRVCSLTEGAAGGGDGGGDGGNDEAGGGAVTRGGATVGGTPGNGSSSGSGGVKSVAGSGAPASGAAGSESSPGSGGAAGGADTGSGGSPDAGGGGSSGSPSAGGSAGTPVALALPDRVFMIPEERDCYSHSPIEVPAEICSGTCGNGMLDACEIPNVACPGTGGPCQPLEAQEECDAELLGDLTCQSIGFERGELACSSTCRYDWARCGVCGTDPRIEDCVRVEGTYYASTGQSLALASDGTRAAIAWPERSNTSALGRVRFALVNDDLSLSVSDCFGEELDSLDPLLATIPTGFALVHTDSTDELSYAIRVTLFDREGNLGARPEPTLPGRPKDLVARPDGGPLLIYYLPAGVAGEQVGAVMAALLDEGGEPLWTRRLADSTNLYESVTAYTDDGFLWVSHRSLGEDPLVARIEIDGTVTTSVLDLPEDDYYPSLTWNGSESEARLFWDEFWIPLDKYGAALGPAQTLLAQEASQPRSTPVDAGTATLLLTGSDEPPLGALGSGSSSGHHELVLVDNDGNAAEPIAVFRNGNQGPNFQHQVVTVGDRVLVAARSDDQRLGDSIYLAWIRP